MTTQNHHCLGGTNVRGFLGNPRPRIHIPTNLYTIICFIFIKIILITTKLHPNELGKFWLPRNIDPHK